MDQTRKCPRCGEPHQLKHLLCRECNNQAVAAYRAGDKHARNTHYRKALPQEEPLCSQPPPPPPGFDPRDLRRGKPAD